MMTTGRQYELLITLVAADIGIERRVVVADQTTLAELHLVIQAAMGWTNSHLHSFTTRDGKTYGDLLDDGLDDFGDGAAYSSEDATVVGDLLREPLDAITYEYDFGDSWLHHVELAAVRSGDQALADAPACIGGKAACPPEDCGGSEGYADLLDALADPAAADEELIEWARDVVGPAFNPDAFDRAEADATMRRLVGDDGRLRWPDFAEQAPR